MYRASIHSSTIFMCMLLSHNTCSITTKWSKGGRAHHKERVSLSLPACLCTCMHAIDYGLQDAACRLRSAL
jgi:hypothetical protein